jgi:hypothetical protein
MVSTDRYPLIGAITGVVIGWLFRPSERVYYTNYQASVPEVIAYISGEKMYPVFSRLAQGAIESVLFWGFVFFIIGALVDSYVAWRNGEGLFKDERT